jgi:hypothetical protein
MNKEDKFTEEDIKELIFDTLCDCHQSSTFVYRKGDKANSFFIDTPSYEDIFEIIIKKLDTSS